MDASLRPAEPGFSAKISDPRFAAYQASRTRYARLFSLILFLGALVGFPLYGAASGEITWPGSLLYGLGIGTMFLLIGFFSGRISRKDHTWDGTVTGKRYFKKRKQDRYGEGWTDRMIYVVTVTRDDGKEVEYRYEDDSTRYDYFRAGDRVRHHRGFGGVEKEDKTGDDFVFCLACGSINEWNGSEDCFRCGCPLPK